MRARTLGPLALAAAALPGCLSGWLFTDVTLPVVTNVENTPRHSQHVELDSHDFKLRGITWAEVYSRAIGDAARVHGLKRIHFADMRTISVLGGLYRRRTIQVWGD